MNVVTAYPVTGRQVLRSRRAAGAHFDNRVINPGFVVLCVCVCHIASSRLSLDFHLIMAMCLHEQRHTHTHLNRSCNHRGLSFLGWQPLVSSSHLSEPGRIVLPPGFVEQPGVG